MIKEEKPNKLFNDYNFGEALIFEDIPVFFDARADVYASENILSDGINLLLMQCINEQKEDAYWNVDEEIAYYEFDAILILKSRPLYLYLMSHPGKYEVVMDDEIAAYFRVKQD